MTAKPTNRLPAVYYVNIQGECTSRICREFTSAPAVSHFLSVPTLFLYLRFYCCFFLPVKASYFMFFASRSTAVRLRDGAIFPPPASKPLCSLRNCLKHGEAKFTYAYILTYPSPNYHCNSPTNFTSYTLHHNYFTVVLIRLFFYRQIYFMTFNTTIRKYCKLWPHEHFICYIADAFMFSSKEEISKEELESISPTMALRRSSALEHISMRSLTRSRQKDYKIEFSWMRTNPYCHTRTVYISAT